MKKMIFFVISDDSDDDVPPAQETAEKKDVVILSDDEMDDSPLKTESLEEIKITNVVECNSLQAFDDEISDCEEKVAFDSKVSAKTEENGKIKDELKLEEQEAFDFRGSVNEKIEDDTKFEENIIQKTKEQGKKRASVMDMELSDLEEEYYEEPELLLCNTPLGNSSKLCDVCRDKNGIDLCPKCVPVQFSETMLIINEFEENPKFCEKCGDEIESECKKCVKKKKVAERLPKFNKRLRLNHECPICSKAFRTSKDLERHLKKCL